ncbi:hypothetical protein BG004_003735 [Podila humilis]|nr:hypothetical protein BG004_003735 [Podila humilis]
MRSEIQEEYRRRSGGQENLVRANDVFSAVHAFILSNFTLVQTYIYKRDESQRLSIPSKMFIVGAVVSTFSVLSSAMWSKSIERIDVLYFVSYVKLVISVIKYCPQVYINYKVRSTVGWSIGNILLDFSGGVLSTAQIILDAYLSGDWSSISGDPAKFGLGFVSIAFDVIFIVQHYILYRGRDDFYASLSMRGKTLDKARKERQEEWEKAYKNSENPPTIQEEVPYDPRTLYERLQEQRQKKDDVFAEATKFGNLIHRIDNDEFDFLSTLENDEAQKKRDQAEQEAKDLEAFRRNQLKPQPLLEPTTTIAGLGSSTTSFTPARAGQAAGLKKSKKSLFSGLVKRKESSTTEGSSNSPPSKDTPYSSEGPTDEANSFRKRKASDGITVDKEQTSNKAKKAPESQGSTNGSTVTSTVALTAPKGGLLGLVAYDSSSDEEE